MIILTLLAVLKYSILFSVNMAFHLVSDVTGLATFFQIHLDTILKYLTELSYSSAYHHSSNPAEHAIHTVKNLMKRGYHANESWRSALLEYLATPLDSNLPSPSELNRRQFSGLLPNLRCNSLPDSTSKALIDQHKKQLNRAHGKELRDLPEGSTIS